MTANTDPVAVSDDGAMSAGSTEHAYDQLRARILGGELRPGASFSQVQLAGEIGVSRTPLREAVRRLQSEGLLIGEHNRRVRVAPLSTQDFEGLYAMRIALDSLATRISVPALSDADLAHIRDYYEQTTDAVARDDAEAYREPHRRFHLAIYQHAGDRLLAQVVDLWDHAERYRLLLFRAVEQPQVTRMIIDDHAAIFAAVQQRDAATCAREIAGHLARTALMAMVRVDHRHSPSSIYTALDLVCAEPPSTPGAKTSGADVSVPGYMRDSRPSAGA